MVSDFTRDDMHALLTSCGLQPQDDIDRFVAHDRYLGGHPGGLTPTGSFPVSHAVVLGGR